MNIIDDSPQARAGKTVTTSRDCIATLAAAKSINGVICDCRVAKHHHRVLPLRRPPATAVLATAAAHAAMVIGPIGHEAVAIDP
jgi:hypothetical protein